MAFERALSGRVWIKNLFFELFPMICIFSWWIKSLIPKIFLIFPLSAWIKNDHEENWSPSACQSRINCIPFHIHESVLQLFWEHLFLMWIGDKYIPWSCRFSGTKYNHVPKLNASHQWKLIRNKRRKWSENECTIEGITPQWVRQAFDLAAFDFVKLKAFLIRLGVIPTMVTCLTS